MSPKLQKILGCLLLILGLGIIILGLYSSYQIFSAKVSAPEIFKIQAVEPSSQTKSVNPIEGMLGIDIGKILGGEIEKALPADSIPRLLNLISWSIFAGILTLGGGQIAALGIKLLK